MSFFHSKTPYYILTLLEEIQRGCLVEAAGPRQVVGMSPVLSSAIGPEAMFSSRFTRKATLSIHGDSVQK